jgi:hypothetical protein
VRKKGAGKRGGIYFAQNLSAPTVKKPPGNFICNIAAEILLLLFGSSGSALIA